MKTRSRQMSIGRAGSPACSAPGRPSAPAANKAAATRAAPWLPRSADPSPPPGAPVRPARLTIGTLAYRAAAAARYAKVPMVSLAGLTGAPGGGDGSADRGSHGAARVAAALFAAGALGRPGALHAGEPARPIDIWRERVFIASPCESQPSGHAGRLTVPAARTAGQGFSNLREAWPAGQPPAGQPTAAPAPAVSQPAESIQEAYSGTAAEPAPRTGTARRQPGRGTGTARRQPGRGTGTGPGSTAAGDDQVTRSGRGPAATPSSCNRRAARFSPAMAGHGGCGLPPAIRSSRLFMISSPTSRPRGARSPSSATRMTPVPAPPR